MGTQDEKNAAAPQNEFISGFKGGAISPGKETEQPFVTRPGKKATGLSSGRRASSLQSDVGANPYQLKEQMSRNTGTEKFSNDPFKNNSSSGFIQKVKAKFFNEKSAPGDARQKVMVVMIPILFIIMIFMFRQVLWKAPAKTKAADKDKKSAIAVKKSSSDDIEWKIPDPLPVQMRDPIRFEADAGSITGAQQTSNSSDAAVLNVKSILYSDDKPSVVIGDRLVYLNGKINGAIVVEIHKDYIVFEKDGKRWSQKVAEEVFMRDRLTNKEPEPKQS